MSIILGLSDYKKRALFLREKASGFELKQKKSNPFTTLSHGAEDQMRHSVNQNYNFNFIPLVVKNEKYPFFHASLDGIDIDRKIIWECKLTGKEKYGRVFNNEIPKEFYFQIQYQFLISGYETAILSCIKCNMKERKNFKTNAHKVVKRNDDAINKIILPEIMKFLEDVEELKKKLKK